MKQQGFILSLVAIICLSGLVTTQDDEDIAPVDAVAELEQDLELQCEVTGDLYDESSVVWSVHGKEIDLSNKEKYETSDFNNTLLIYDVTKEDVTNYTCSFTLSNGQNFSTIIRVESKPSVTEFTKSKNLVQGDPLTLTCETWGVPLPTVVWWKDDEKVDDSDSRVSFEDKDGVTNATLRIKDLDFDDRAEYTCVANNGHATVNTTVLVRVKDKLAALWPFLGICAEVAILCLIIFIYEKRRAKKMEEEEQQEEAGHLTNSNDHKGKDDIRHRK